VVQNSQLIGSHPVLSFTLAGCCFGMGITSFIWHASLSNKGATMDFGCMYVLIDYIIGLCALRLLAFFNFKGNQKLLTALVHLVAAGGLVIGLWMYKRNFVKKFKNQSKLIMYLIVAVVGLVPLPFLFGIIRMLKNTVLGFVCGNDWADKRNKRRSWRKERHGIRRRRSWGLGISALICMLGAYYFRMHDEDWMCTDLWGPHEFMQAHAIWHTGCAFAVLFVYCFLRSEVRSNEDSADERRLERSNGKSIILPSKGWSEATAYRLSEIFNSSLRSSPLHILLPFVTSLIAGLQHVLLH